MASQTDAASPKVQDFATAASPTSGHSHGTTLDAPHPARGEQLHIDTQLDAHSPVRSSRRGRSTSQVSATAAHADGSSMLSPARYSVESGLRRRPTRSNTVRHYHHQETPVGQGWEEPGAEPGVDTKKETDQEIYSHLHQLCDITVVDFSDERVEYTELENHGLDEFLSTPKQEWVQCRWINVNGLSWDVIRTLGNHKQLHRLAIEDLMNTRGRTKADWYADQAFCKSQFLRGR